MKSPGESDKVRRNFFRLRCGWPTSAMDGAKRSYANFVRSARRIDGARFALPSDLSRLRHKRQEAYLRPSQRPSAAPPAAPAGSDIGPNSLRRRRSAVAQAKSEPRIAGCRHGFVRSRLRSACIFLAACVSKPTNFRRCKKTDRRLLLAAVIVHARCGPAALAGPPIGAVEMGFAHWFMGSPHFRDARLLRGRTPTVFIAHSSCARARQIFGKGGFR